MDLLPCGACCLSCALRFCSAAWCQVLQMDVRPCIQTCLRLARLQDSLVSRVVNGHQTLFSGLPVACWWEAWP